MPPPGADGARWDARIARARALARQHPAASEILTFYAELATFQKAQLEARPPSARERAELDVGRIASAVPALIDLLSRTAPALLAEAAGELRAVDRSDWHALIERYWSADAHEIPDTDDVMLFVVEALLQPFAEALATARGGGDPPQAAADSPPRTARCPACGGKPVVGVLREAGQGARRSLVCGTCLFEWPWPRVTCPSCGESSFDALPVFRADAFKAARVDACDTCRKYLKTIDLSTDGLAIPVVDELAALPLDLWAREQGYAKLRPNLLRM
ncbi:MAG: formate dehydrogenase accessory protein FdhE [Gemmatimonadales bacterium]